MSDYDEMIDELTAQDLQNPYLGQTYEPSVPNDQNDSKKKPQEFYNPDQLRDQGGRFADEGKGAGEPGYQHPDEAEITGIDKRIVDYVAHRPLSRGKSEDVKSVRDYVPDMHYIPYSKTPFFDRLNELQGTPDIENTKIEDFAAARKALFKDQPTKTLKIKNLIATQPVVNSEKVGRNVEEGKVKAIAVVKYGGKNYVMDGHHALAAAAQRGDKKIEAHVLKMGLVNKLPSEPKPVDMEMFSPNTGEMTFKEARKALTGASQQAARKIANSIDAKLGMEATSHDGIGVWSDGAENSVVAEFDKTQDFDELQYNAALKGKALNQKAVLAFKYDRNGKDAVHQVVLPTGDLDEVQKRLDKAGIEHKTLVKDKNRTCVVVFDSGNKLGDSLAKAARKYGKKIRPTTIKGTGKFVGEADTREAAQGNYDKFIAGYQQRHPDRRHHA